VRIGAKHIPQAELNQMLLAADFAALKDKEIAFYYGGKISHLIFNALILINFNILIKN
jgi:hypothetical protein